MMKIRLSALATVAALGIVAAPLSALAADPAALAKSKNCMTCHSVDKKVIGPAYKDVAAKFASDKNAVAMLAEKIQKGSSGVWGQVPMPANNVTADEAKELATWVMSQK